MVYGTATVQCLFVQLHLPQDFEEDREENDSEMAESLFMFLASEHDYQQIIVIYVRLHFKILCTYFNCVYDMRSSQHQKYTHTRYICRDLWLGKCHSPSSSALWQEMLNTLRLVVGGGRTEWESIEGVGCGGMMLSTGRSWQMGENGTE